MLQQKQHKIIISGGGTGGHVFPAISIANALRKLDPACDILFVGATGKLEMEKVPEAGYPIVGLPVVGLQRRLTVKNLSFPAKLLRSLQKAKRILNDFNPDVVVGVGGYASGPMLRKSAARGIPTLIQEQNSYAGLTNKLLARNASVICVAYQGMETYFPAGKIVFTGNPVRQDLLDVHRFRTEALAHFGLDPHKKTLLVIGGSLGAGTINTSIAGGLEQFRKNNIQVIWQCGKMYYKKYKQIVGPEYEDSIHLHPFIIEMKLAYAAADVILSRAGAGTISELAIVGKPVVLVPSPIVAEDHQTRNAMSLVRNHAALMIADRDAAQKLVTETIGLMEDQNRLSSFSENIKKLAMPGAADHIAKEILKLVADKEYGA